MPVIMNGIGDTIQILQHCPTLPESLTIAHKSAAEIGEICNFLNIPIRIIDSHRQYNVKAEIEAVHGRLDEEDWSISRVFPLIMAGHWHYERNIFPSYRFPRWHKEDYAVVQAASMNKCVGRDLTKDELNWIMRKTDKKILLVGKGDFLLPRHHRVIDCSNVLNVMETIGVVVHASEYFGIDGFASIVACGVGIPVYIKSVNPQYYQFVHCFQAPGHRNIHTLPYLIGEREEKC